VARSLAAGAAIAGLIGAIGLGYVMYLGERSRGLDRQTAEQLKLAIAAARPREAEARRERDWVLAQRGKAPALSLMIEELAHALPDDAHLERLEMRDGVVTITGKAQNAPALIGALEAAPIFDQVQFAAPTTRQTGETSDGFSISSRVKPMTPTGQGRRP
jgi:Tfp pilus assembly protein PilN